MSDSLNYPQVSIYTDGACLGNPGPGGWAAILIYNQHRKEFSGGFAQTTNNRMELMAIIQGLKSLKKTCNVHIYTDSRYIHDALNKGWLNGWQKNGWRTADKKPVKNQDLWREILSLINIHKVKFNWIPGHAGQKENERCDQLAKKAAKGQDLPLDSGYK